MWKNCLSSDSTVSPKLRLCTQNLDNETIRKAIEMHLNKGYKFTNFAFNKTTLL